MQAQDVTLVVVPRDHFSDARESLDSILAHTDRGVRIVYVDGNSPHHVARHLRAHAAQGRIELLRQDRFLTPNEARNLGAARVTSTYMVFVDNDVVVAPGWLPPLVACAEATGGAVVGPLNFESRPLHETVHFAGGEVRIESVERDGRIERRLIDRIHKTGIPATWRATDCAEFHCMLVRRDAFARVGGLDERLLSTRENIDFCLALRALGETVWLEPRSHITYLPPAPLRWSDVPYFALRWSDAWDLASFHHLRDKWQLDEDDYFRRQYENLGWRRRGLMMRESLLRWLGPWRLRIAAERALRPLERRINARLARRHARRHPRSVHAS